MNVLEFKELADGVARRACSYLQLPHKILIIIASQSGDGPCIAYHIISLLEPTLNTNSEVQVTILAEEEQQYSQVKDFIRPQKIHFIKGTICDSHIVSALMNKKQVDVVLIVGCPSCNASSKQLRDYESGVKKVLEDAKRVGVKRLVATTLASSIYSGSDLVSATEAAAVPERTKEPYLASVAAVEKAILAANSSTEGVGGLQTCIIRPQNTYGCYDLGLVPSLSKDSGKLRRCSGSDPMTDFTYGGNVAHAVLLAAERLVPDSAVSGILFNITDDSPVPYWDFVGQIRKGFGYTALAPATSYVILFITALIQAFVACITFSNAAPIAALKRSRKHQWFNIEKAKSILGYKPLWTREEALQIIFQSKDAAKNRDPKAVVKWVGPFTPKEVAKHNTSDDLWIIVDQEVYDVTGFIYDHPGGDAIMNNAGGDSTKGMYGPQHPPQVFEILAEYHIGALKV